MGQPTRGVDIGAIEFIHQEILRLRDAGKAILLVSVELDEILSLSDRIAVMFDGQIMGERLPSETDQTELGLLMAGVTDTGGKRAIDAVDAALTARESREGSLTDPGPARRAVTSRRTRPCFFLDQIPPPEAVPGRDRRAVAKGGAPHG